MKKENLPLIVAIGLPILLIIIVALFALLPKYLSKPEYKFVYTEDIGSRYYAFGNNICTIYRKYYELDSANKIIMKDFYVSPFSDAPEEDLKKPCNGFPTAFKDAPDLYLYDFVTDTSSKIAPESVGQHTIVSEKESPDGFQVAYRYGHNGIFELFGSSNDRSGIYLIKNGPIRTLNLETTDESAYGSRDFRFIGWVR